MENEKIENYSLYCEYYDKKKVNSKIVFFESHNGIDFAGNMLSIARELSENAAFSGLELYISYTDESKALIEGLIETYSIRCRALVKRESKEYFEILATAGFLFTDVAYYSLYRKKKGQVCVSTWHGTPLKTLGFTFCEDAYVVGNQKRGFLLADYFVCPNEYTWKCIEESYQLRGLFHGEIIYEGYPRNAVFFREARREEVRKELGYEDKKVVVYMPTWRGKVIKVDGKGQTAELQQMLEQMDALLPDDYVLLAKLHRLNRAELDFEALRHIEAFPEGYETYDVLNIADALVTDYSSVMFDFEVTRKKIILFCYDKEEYVENRGCYFHPKELPFPIVTEVPELVKEICSGKNYDDSAVIEKFNPSDNAQSAANICRRIFLEKRGHSAAPVMSGGKKRALVFVGELGENSATDSLFFAFDKLKEFDCYITYMNHLFKEKWYKLLQFPGRNQIPMYMYQGRYSNYTRDENEAAARIRKCIQNRKAVSKGDWELMEKVGIREYERYRYQNRFDIFIRYAGLDLESLKWFRVYRGAKVLVIHENMVQKATENAEYRIYLGRAMEAADTVYYANRSIFETAEKLFSGIKTRKAVADLY